MSVYERDSRACDLTGMDAGLADRIKVWAEEMGLTPALGRVTAGCETASGRHGAHGIFGRMSQMPKRVVTGALLTPDWLIWATKADEGEPFVTGVRLADVQIRDYRSTPDYTLMVDEGLQINGVLGGSPEMSSMFLGLGEEPDGRAFKEKVLSVWRAARAAWRPGRAAAPPGVQPGAAVVARGAARDARCAAGSGGCGARDDWGPAIRPPVCLE